MRLKALLTAALATGALFALAARGPSPVRTRRARLQLARIPIRCGSGR